jgi:nucleotide-binding universal stress UspA family protein
MKILVAVDGSLFTKRMLAYLAAHDEWLGTHHVYTVLNVVPRLPARAAAVVSKGVLEEYYAKEAETVFKPIRTFFAKQGLSATFVTRGGEAGETIAAVANKGGFDLVMLGSHGHGSLGTLVMGSVANKVVAHCTVPLLIVR